MPFKATNPRAVNKLKHSLLYDDPAFSADPTANPLCAVSHDISSWTTEPPKGHPVIRPREFHADPQSGEVALIQPPNSPVYLNAQPHLVKPMKQSTESTLAFSPPTSVPDLSSTASSASDSSLPTPTASHLSLGTSQTTTTMSLPASTKKRIGLPFFRRKPAPEHPASQPINISATNAISSAPKQSGALPDSFQSRLKDVAVPLQNQHQHQARATASMPSQAFRGYQHATGSARELDMIDELDETNPSGVALHHGGPYEGIQKTTVSHAQSQRPAYTTNQQSPAIYRRQFRFDAPLNLSPGQILPHSVTAHYRPQAAPASNVQERVGVGAPIVSHTGRKSEPPLAADHVMNSVAKQDSVASSTFAHGLRGMPLGPSHRHTSSEPVVLPDNGRLNTHLPRVPPSRFGVSQPTTASHLSVAPGNVIFDPTSGERVVAQTSREQEQYTYDDPRKRGVADLGNPQMPHVAAHRSNAEERPQGFAGGAWQPSPHLGRVEPSISQSQYRQQEVRPESIHNIPQSHYSVASSNSTLRSGASSVMTATTNASSVGTSRSRMLPKQLVMPAPLAKATASSRPLPTLPQQHWQNMRQHRIRFGDGTEYELPVTNMNTPTRISSIPELPHVVEPRATTQTTRTLSISHNGKLKKRSSFHGPEPPEIVARLAVTPGAIQKTKYMEPPPTIPEMPRIEKSATNASVKHEMKRLLSKRRSAF